MRASLQLLVLLLLLILPCMAKLRPEHVSDMKYVFNGYGDASFKELSEAVSAGMDETLPAMYREKLGPLPGNHRILGHPWALNDSIPSNVMEELTKNYPGKEDVVLNVWEEFATNLNAKAQRISGLPETQAKALAAMLYDVHLLGDYEPGNVRVDIVLQPELTVQNFIKESKALFKNQPQLAVEIEQRLEMVLKNSKKVDGQVLAQRLLDEMMSLDIGGKLNKTWGKTLKTKYYPTLAELAAQNKANRSMTRIAAKGRGSLKTQKTPLSKAQLGKRIGKGVLRPAALLSDGRILVPLRDGSQNALLILALDMIEPTYQYVRGDIRWGDFERRLAEASVKAGAVGAATGIAIIIGFTPGGVVVLGVALAAYEVTDIVIKATRHEYFSPRDLEALGGELNSILQPPADSILELHPNSVLQPELNTVLQLEESSVLDIFPQ